MFQAFPEGWFWGTSHRSLLRDPVPGTPHLSRSPGLLRSSFGRSGKPIKKLILITAEDAHAIARSFQGTKGTTGTVI